MKHSHKIIGIIVVVLLWPWDPVYPQFPIRLGVDTGINLANQSFSHDPFNPKVSRSGVIIGGLAEIGISDLWCVQVEPRYIQKGMKETGFVITGNDPTPLSTTNLVFKLDYLEIPVLLKATLGRDNFRPIVFAGPNVGFLLSAKNEWERYDAQQQGIIPASIDVTERYNSIDLSLDFGVGGEYQISPSVSLLADARYSLGLIDLNNIHVINYLACPSCPYIGISTIKSYGIQILVGTLFSL
ncbi:MAG: PorT family protein [Ignavibacteriae bacterium]|nr:PorT family protein [Ignavibacteria bacterium]MBI3365005.1 PorT family protein [Ignavibacteriota bacterium]